MNAPNELIHRRAFLRHACLRAGGVNLGGMALASLLGQDNLVGQDKLATPRPVAKARHVIYLFMHGGPSQLDLFDHKPDLKKLHGQELPASVRGSQRLTSFVSSDRGTPKRSIMIRR